MTRVSTVVIRLDDIITRLSGIISGLSNEVMARLTSLIPLLNRGWDWSGLVQDRSLISHKILRTRTGPLRTRVGPGLQSGPKSVQSSLVLGLFAVLGLDLQTLPLTSSVNGVRICTTPSTHINVDLVIVL